MRAKAKAGPAVRPLSHPLIATTRLAVIGSGRIREAAANTNTQPSDRLIWNRRWLPLRAHEFEERQPRQHGVVGDK